MSVTSLALAELTARAEPAKASKMTGLVKPAEDGNLDIPLMSITSLLNFIHSATCRSDEDKSTQTFKLSKDFQEIYNFMKLSCLLTNNSEKTYNQSKQWIDVTTTNQQITLYVNERKRHL